MQIHNDKDDIKDDGNIEYFPIAAMKTPTYALIAARDKHRACSPALSFKTSKFVHSY